MKGRGTRGLLEGVLRAFADGGFVALRPKVARLMKPLPLSLIHRALVAVCLKLHGSPSP